MSKGRPMRTKLSFAVTNPAGKVAINCLASIVAQEVKSTIKIYQTPGVVDYKPFLKNTAIFTEKKHAINSRPRLPVFPGIHLVWGKEPSKRSDSFSVEDNRFLVCFFFRINLHSSHASNAT